MKYILQQIDDSLLRDHLYLEANDKCYFYGEYAGRQGYAFSETNQLIFNFKKPMKARNKPDWQYKIKAIETISQILPASKGWAKLRQYTWAPIPPSKDRNDPEYDDRLLQVLLKLKETEQCLDVREILLAQKSRNAAHAPDNQVRPTIKDHISNLVVDKALLTPAPKAIAVFDDVLTTGASFKAAQYILRKAFPSIPIIGIFVARNINLIDDI
ncbi:TPA: hypothetical protein JAG55_002940 [Legionella pneumophila]|uniref:hypothetical protein n=1 Tax=Legionella pneumophila TaxID=446 RepID=UPI001A2BF613|nr:hypothetical protein [Legionella pneumophila]MCW8435232.1 hypothetical protein [Legionella pneumophila]WAI64677.1 hypothetical protein OXA89_00975 [Legionella pneumophila]WAI67664.1 hypothetical protein OXA87_00975 [Legionella pneumophila]HAT5923637.1 hypothetical protein [Legionella pneumophila]HAT5936452.1 hypothetical protein [Legionella pneumophila]